MHEYTYIYKEKWQPSLWLRILTAPIWIPLKLWRVFEDWFFSDIL